MEKNCKNWGFPANDHITHIFNPYWAIFTLLPSMCVKLQKLELSSVIACRVSIFGLDFLLGIAWGPFFLIWVSFLSIFLQLKLWFQQSLFFHEMGRNIAVCVVLFLMFLSFIIFGIWWKWTFFSHMLLMMLVEVVHMATTMRTSEKRSARELMSCQAITMDPKMLLLTSF